MEIFDEIKKAKNILLHLHPRPDGDSVGGALAMMHVLEGVGKSVTVIKGDSPLPLYLSALPGFERIVEKNFFEIDLKEFDLFIIQDSSTISFVSQLGEVVFPESLKTIVIDHHVSNVGFGQINLIVSEIPAVCQVLFNLFNQWGVTISKDAAACLFIGIYADTGAFSYSSTLPSTIAAAASLAEIAGSLSHIFLVMNNSNTKGKIAYEGLALSSVRTFLNDHVAISVVSLSDLQKNNISPEEAKADIANELKSVIGWEIGVSMIELEKDHVKVSFRTRDSEKFDLTKAAGALGGGGHKAAAATIIKLPIEEAVKKLVDTVGEIYKF